MSVRKRKPKVKVPRHVPGVQQVTATPPTVECGGRTWRLGFNTQDAKGRLEELFRAHVVRDALKTKRLLGGEDGDEAYRETDKLVKQGHYRTFARGWLDLLNSPVGAVLYVLSLAQQFQPDATEDDVLRLMSEEPEQTQAAVESISPDFFRAAAIQVGADLAAADSVAAAVRSRGTATAEPGTGSRS